MSCKSSVQMNLIPALPIYWQLNELASKRLMFAVWRSGDSYLMTMILERGLAAEQDGPANEALACSITRPACRQRVTMVLG